MYSRSASAFFAIAMEAGLIHGAASLYWALGGNWLLVTVGQFAVEMQREGGLQFHIMLGAIAGAKIAAAVIPWVDHRTAPRMPGSGWSRGSGPPRCSCGVEPARRAHGARWFSDTRPGPTPRFSAMPSCGIPCSPYGDWRLPEDRVTRS